MPDTRMTPVQPVVSGEDDAELSALLDLLRMTSGAQGAFVCAGSSPRTQTILSSAPNGLSNRSQQLSVELLETCGHGVTPTEKLLLPTSTAAWLGFLPRAVCSVRVSSNPDAQSYLFLWWADLPNPTPDLTQLEHHSIQLLRSFAARFEAASRLHRLQERLDAVLSNVSLGIVFIDLLAGSLLNPLAARWLDLPPETRETARVVAAMRQTKARCTIVPGEEDGGINPGRSTEYWVSRRQNVVLRVESHAMGHGDSPGRFWVFTDVKPLWDSAEKLKSANMVLQRNIGLLAEEMHLRMEAESELRRYNAGLKEQNAELEIGKLESDLLANQDPVTGLANNRRFRAALEDTLTEARHSGDRVAVVFLDLDRFKQVNDTCGHDEGDNILRRVGDILVKSLRRDDIIARLGGDEFTCALRFRGEEGYRDLVNTTQRLCEALRLPVQSRTGEIVVTASIGIAVFPEDATDSTNLVRAADNAMYLSKRERGGVVFFGKRDRKAAELATPTA